MSLSSRTRSVMLASLVVAVVVLAGGYAGAEAISPLRAAEVLAMSIALVVALSAGRAHTDGPTGRVNRGLPAYCGVVGSIILIVAGAVTGRTMFRMGVLWLAIGAAVFALRLLDRPDLASVHHRG